MSVLHGERSSSRKLRKRLAEEITSSNIHSLSKETFANLMPTNAPTNLIDGLLQDPEGASILLQNQRLPVTASVDCEVGNTFRSDSEKLELDLGVLNQNFDKLGVDLGRLNQNLVLLIKIQENMLNQITKMARTKQTQRTNI